MEIRFYKYQGTGNDFIMINGLENSSILDHLEADSISALCDRHFGIGADGLIVLSPSFNHDFKMIYFNSDGNESTMCGNGGRCICRFASNLNLVEGACSFEAIDGVHSAIISEEIALRMIDVSGISYDDKGIIINTGSPHYVQFVDSLEIPDFVNRASAIRYSNTFAEEGINVNFVNIENKIVSMRTYERGVEDETLSCGTGVVAAAISAYLKDPGLGNTINLHTPGGKLKVSFVESAGIFSKIDLIGPAEMVFTGTIEI